MSRIETINAWDELLGRLYSPSDQSKIEWAIGAAVSGMLGKIVVLEGPARSGKTTVLEIVRRIFELDPNPHIVIRDSGHLTHFPRRTFMFIAANNSDFLEKMERQYLPRVLPVSGTGHTHTPEKYERLMSKVLDGLPTVVNRCLSQYRILGMNYYDGLPVDSE